MVLKQGPHWAFIPFIREHLLWLISPIEAAPQLI
jgi:hypothetical protein